MTTLKIQIRFFTTELNILSENTWNQKATITPSNFFFDSTILNIKPFYKSCQEIARIAQLTGNNS